MITDQIRFEAEKRGLTLPLKIVRDADSIDRLRIGDLDTSFFELDETFELIEYVGSKWLAGYKVEEAD